MIGIQKSKRIFRKQFPLSAKVIKAVINNWSTFLNSGDNVFPKGCWFILKYVTSTNFLEKFCTVRWNILLKHNLSHNNQRLKVILLHKYSGTKTSYFIGKPKYFSVSTLTKFKFIINDLDFWIILRHIVVLRLPYA